VRCRYRNRCWRCRRALRCRSFTFPKRIHYRLRLGIRLHLRCIPPAPAVLLGRRPPQKSLLHLLDVRDLVSNQQIAHRRPRPVLALGEIDIFPCSDRARIPSLGDKLRIATGMNARR
jgi:hypothetical protein